MALVIRYQAYNCSAGWTNINGWPTNDPVTEGKQKIYSDACGAYPKRNSKGFRFDLSVAAGETVFVTTTQSGSNDVASLTNQAYTEGTHTINVWFSPNGAVGSGTVTFSLTPPPPECLDNSDCGPCEKCVDGECVPCDECSDGQGELILYCWDPLNGDNVRQIAVNWSNAETLNVPIGGSGWGYSYRT